MGSDSNVDVENDWKVITIFIGGNDICRECNDNITPDIFVDNVQTTLDYLHDNVPRAYVNFALLFDVNIAETLWRGPFCHIFHRIGCPCASFPENEEARSRNIEFNDEYNRLVTELVESGKYDTSDDFTVVTQPAFLDLEVPKRRNRVDLSYFARDCFHLNRNGHIMAAIALWNNMFQAKGQKTTNPSWEDYELVCPTEAQPYLYTDINSPPDGLRARPGPAEPRPKETDGSGPPFLKHSSSPSQEAGSLHSKISSPQGMVILVAFFAIVGMVVSLIIYRINFRRMDDSAKVFFKNRSRMSSQRSDDEEDGEALASHRPTTGATRSSFGDRSSMSVISGTTTTTGFYLPSILSTPSYGHDTGNGANSSRVQSVQRLKRQESLKFQLLCSKVFDFCSLLDSESKGGGVMLSTQGKRHIAFTDTRSRSRASNSQAGSRASSSHMSHGRQIFKGRPLKIRSIQLKVGTEDNKMALVGAS